MKDKTFIIPIIRTDFVVPCLESLAATTTDYETIVIDQTIQGMPHLQTLCSSYLRPHYNLGFAQAMNVGLLMADTEYVILSNDDIELFDPRWWEGILKTFRSTEKIWAVNPMSPKEPGWGWGLPGYIDLADHSELGPEVYDWLVRGQYGGKSFSGSPLPERYPPNRKGLIEGLAMWCTVLSPRARQEVGLFDWRFYPGGGEDYDWVARCYTAGGRAVATTDSWVWHWWSSSKDYRGELPPRHRTAFSNVDSLWAPDSAAPGNPIYPADRARSRKGAIQIMPGIREGSS